MKSYVIKLSGNVPQDDYTSLKTYYLQMQVILSLSTILSKQFMCTPPARITMTCFLIKITTYFLKLFY